MKFPSSQNPTDAASLAKRRRRNRGVALVIVLGFLVLISALLLAFFSSVQTELQGAKSFADSATVKQLADTASNIVTSQIGDATRSYETPGNPATTPPVPGSGKRLTWASQPGLIHTFDDSGKPNRVFKLYSAANMVDESGISSGEAYNPATQLPNEVPSAWPAQPAHFVDLNAPVLVPDSSGPITGVDGRLYTADFPIVDPMALNQVEGFNYDNVPGVQGGKIVLTKGVDPTKADPNYSNNPVPMPVRWLYVLRDGTVTAPNVTSTATSTAAFSNYGPSTTNPIVGRIAFWTDDETSKLNINTASEGVFWDRPWAEGSTERNYAKNLPRQNEFNRFAGHPSVTCLSPVFNTIYPVTQNPPSTAELQPYLGTGTASPGSGLSPRVNVPSDTDGKAVKIKNERLYASVDELLFNPVVSGGKRLPFDSTQTKLNRGALERAKFFITAHSRSPEVNLFGQPRIAVWPLQYNVGNPNLGDRTAKDRLIAFCTSVGTPGTESRYYFQRFSKYTGDGLQNQTTPIPSSQDISADWDKIQRNQDLYAYLQRLTGQPIPGFGGNFNTKFGNDRDQVLTEITDYIRASVNSYNTALDPKYDYLPSRGFPKPGETQAVPLYIAKSDTKGFGRFATITKAAILFFATNATEDASKPIDKMQAYLLLEPFNPTPGLASWSPHVRYVVEGLDKFKVAGNSMGFPVLDGNLNPRNYVTSRVGYSGGGHTTALMGLQASFRYFKDGGSDQNKKASRTDEESGYPFYSEKIALPSTPFSFSGGDITISIYGGYDPKAKGTGKPTQLIQKITMNFPAASAFPVPTKNEVILNNRFSDDQNKLIRDGDVVQSVEADFANATSAGDYRILAGRYVVGSEFFKKHPKYDTSGVKMAHSLRQNASNFRGATSTNPVRMLAGITTGREPVAARDLNGALLKKGATQLPGDWDNGNGDVEDGAYVNKSDEGNTSTSGDGGYFGRGNFNVEDGTTFSPNRQISSAVAFGSLSTGVKRGLPWQTLLFCKNPAAGDGHPGFDSPRDHLLLDFFTMPIVEPYAISEPFSTAGKVNLNFQIAPFTYITRSTAMRGVMKSTKVMAIPTADAATYKSGGREYRASIDLDQTLSNGSGAGGFAERFLKKASGSPYLGDAGVFRSASEICDMYLVPAVNGGSVSSKVTSAAMNGGLNGWWKDYKLTGDNAREYPYAHIYPRVTTKSNTYTVHFRVQVLRKKPSSSATQWIDGQDLVLSEFRGSSIIERYIDPSDAALQSVDFATNPTASLDDYYRFRIVSSKKFAP